MCKRTFSLHIRIRVHHGAGQVVLNPDADVQTESPFARYTGQSVWATLEAQQAEPVFDDDFVITTSPTAISTYMKCPRQYFYKHLLGLPEAGTVSASLGTLVHKVMEVFNSQTQPGAYTMERLIDLAEALFVFDSDANRFHMAGYGERERRDLTEMSPLALTNLRTRLLASIEDLKNKGYFDRYGSMKAVYAERELREVEIEGIERCRFKGKMDAVIQLADGNWEVVDYKTYGTSKYASKWDSCEKNFQKILEPLPDESGLSHSERFADKMSAAYPIDYQLPLYYLACRQDPLFKDKLEGISLQLVRPQFPKDAGQGAIRLGVSAQDLETKRAQIVADIQNFIVNPLLGSQSFQADPASHTACGYCAYAEICEGAQAEDESGETA
jgi:CRISPR/Cas system-associated exonuclease Cas4 (RecB family)